jgi:ketosteroid isomerase-like protein
MVVTLSLGQGTEGTGMSPLVQSDPKAVIAAWIDAVNKHDVEAIAECFAPDYHDIEPAHPTRKITGGRENVRKNFGVMLQSMPDFRLELLRVASDGDTAWSELDISGTRHDGSREHLRGVNIFGIRDGQIAWGRIYLESVEEDGIDIDERIRRIAEGKSPKAPAPA